VIHDVNLTAQKKCGMIIPNEKSTHKFTSIKKSTIIINCFKQSLLVSKTTQEHPTSTSSRQNQIPVQEESYENRITVVWTFTFNPQIQKVQ
jgi:hypothetical protein